MAVTNFLVSSLPAYVQTNRELIVKSFALVGTATRSRIGLQTGIKKDAYLNYLDLAPTLQDGSSCGFDPLDEIELTQREISTAAIKVDGEICPETLLGKYAEYLVRISATENDLPYEQYILDTLVAQINKKIETLIWLGDTSSVDPNLKWIDGFIYQFDNDSDVVDVAIANGTAIYNAIKAVYMGMSDEALERGGVIFVSPANYRAFLQAMVEKNYFHYSGPQDAAPEEFIFPGTDVKVIKTPGLSGVENKIVGTFASNLVYGCDVEGDEEKFLIKYDEIEELFKIKVVWNSGVSYLFPNHVTLGTIAAL